MKPNQLQSMNDFINFWQDQLNALNSSNESQVLANMVSVATSSFFDKYNEGSNFSELFSETFDMLVELDRGDTPKYYRDAKWQMVKANIRLMQENQTT